MVHGASAITSLRPCIPSPTSTARASCCGISRFVNSAPSTAARSSAGRGRCSTRCRRSSSTASSSAPCWARRHQSAFPSGLDNFALYLLCGLLPWNFFALITSLGLGAISANSGLVRRVAFPREVLVFSNVLHACVQFSIEMTLLLDRAPDRRQSVPPMAPRSSCSRPFCLAVFATGIGNGLERPGRLLPRHELPLGDPHPRSGSGRPQSSIHLRCSRKRHRPGCTTSSSSTR